MKKFMIAVLMMLGTSTAFAGDSDALKSILKAKSYDEAQGLVKDKVNALANPEEKAKAYNFIVELAMKKVNHEQEIITSNQLQQQLNTGKSQAYDTLGYYKALGVAFTNAIECDKWDSMPNEKGKVKPKYHKANQDKLVNLRTELINAGQTVSDNNKEVSFGYFSLYVDSYFSPLFKEVDRYAYPDKYLGEVARVTAVIAFQNKDIEKANKYVDIALNDTASYKEALNLKIYLASQDLRTKEDSVKFANTLKGLYEKDSKNDMVFSQLAAVLQSLGDKDGANKIIESRLAANPNDYSALALKAQNAMNEATQNAELYDVAIENFKKAISVKPNDDALVYTYLAFCLNNKASACQKATEQKAYYKESETYLEKARELDPNRERANWSYPLYQCYYTLYGPNDDRTKEAEALAK